MGVPKIPRDPHTKDCRILGSTLGFHYFRKLPCACTNLPDISVPLKETAIHSVKRQPQMNNIGGWGLESLGLLQLRDAAGVSAHCWRHGDEQVKKQQNTSSPSRNPVFSDNTPR